MLSLVLLFHLMVLTGIIPYNIVWGGRLQSKEQMLVFEVVSILLNAILLRAVLSKAGYIKRLFSVKWLNIILGFFAVLFLLNTVGNLFAEQTLETLLFTPVTFIFSLLCFRILREKAA